MSGWLVVFCVPSAARSFRDRPQLIFNTFII